MMCAWNEFLAILPHRLRPEVDRQGRSSLQELRLRINAPPELLLAGKRVWLTEPSSADDLHFVMNTASRYSPWSASSSAHGYITAPGGHRIGICGQVVCKNGTVSGIREADSLCIRIARDFPGIAKKVALAKDSLLILGAPGWGKTTLLRDLIRQLSETETVGVVDERGEVFPEGMDRGKRTDVLTGCPKPEGIPMLLRTMGPSCIAVDEITEERDCLALIQAANCGVRLLATAHAATAEDFYSRNVYRPLVTHRVFKTLIILQKDKSYITERMTA